jgi:Transposase IS116/IS110/IS902 family
MTTAIPETLTGKITEAKIREQLDIFAEPNQIRGVMKTFGLVVPKGGGRIFETNVRVLLEGQEALAGIVLPLLETWRAARAQAARLDRQLTGVAAVTALSYTSMIENPANFANSRAVGAFVGLTARSYQSGEMDYDGHISKRGDKHVRSLLYEAATVVLTRVRSNGALRTWGLKLKERDGCAFDPMRRWLDVVAAPVWRPRHALICYHFASVLRMHRDVPAGAWARPFRLAWCGCFAGREHYIGRSIRSDAHHAAAVADRGENREPGIRLSSEQGRMIVTDDAGSQGWMAGSPSHRRR